MERSHGAINARNHERSFAMKKAKRLARLMTIAVVLSAGALAPAAAQTFRTNEVGGPGGAAFSDLCRAGDVLIGINFNAGKALNTIGPVCSPAKNGGIVGQPYGLHTWGTPSEDFFPHGGSVWCYPNMAIQSLKVNVDGNDNVRSFYISCRNMATGEVVLDSRTSVSSGITVRTDVAPCGSGTIATGVIGGHGALIDRLGLICSRFEDRNGKVLPVVGTGADGGGILPKDKPVRAVGKAVGNGTPADPVRPPGQVDNGDDAGGGGILPKDKPVRAVGKAVGKGTANTDTTIYDEPEGSDIAYLSAGDGVTIVQCSEKVENWCEISKPARGWVWEPELDH